MIKLGDTTISDDELAVLAHVLIEESPEDWVRRVYERFGIAAVRAKIERWKDDYEGEKDRPDYEDARTRERRGRAEEKASLEAAHAEGQALRKAEDQRIKDLIRAEVTRQLG